MGSSDVVALPWCNMNLGPIRFPTDSTCFARLYWAIHIQPVIVTRSGWMSNEISIHTMPDHLPTLSRSFSVCDQTRWSSQRINRKLNLSLKNAKNICSTPNLHVIGWKTFCSFCDSKAVVALGLLNLTLDYSLTAFLLRFLRFHKILSWFTSNFLVELFLMSIFTFLEWYGWNV